VELNIENRQKLYFIDIPQLYKVFTSRSNEKKITLDITKMKPKSKTKSNSLHGDYLLVFIACHLQKQSQKESKAKRLGVRGFTLRLGQFICHCITE
jgi:hypothetical protein